MERFLVTGGARLTGTVEVAGAKNSVLKLMAAALLAEGTTHISNCPEILDVPLMADVLRGLGCDGDDRTADRVSITTPADLSSRADFPAVSRLRASVCVLGPLMGRCRQADGRAAGRRRDRLAARWTCTSPACARWARTMSIEHGKRGRLGEPAARGRRSVSTSRASGRPRTS